MVSRVHSSAYRNPTSLPDGAVLVVGTGQSGAQIAEDLHLAGREVHLSVGSAPRVARRWRGRDVVAWLHDIGHYELPIDEHPEGLGARKEPNHYVTGRDGGHDLDLRTFATQGMHLHGRLAGMGPDGHVRFAADLRANLDGADETYDRINDTIDKWIAERGIDAPAGTTRSVAWEPDAADGGGELDLEDAGISSIVWATGYESDWDWVAVDGLLDETGYPAHARGVTEVPGLHVIGLPWLHTWGSGRFAAVARDAKHLSGHIAAAARVAEAAEALPSLTDIRPPFEEIRAFLTRKGEPRRTREIAGIPTVSHNSARAGATWVIALAS